jgi:outer membrane protein TolC
MHTMIKKLCTGLLLLGIATTSWAQNLTLESCYESARNNYPLIKQKELITKSSEYTISNARTGHLPQVSVFGQASYQSDVTQVPINVPGVDVPTLSKDQYKIYAEVSQTLYDGGSVRRQTNLQQVNAKVEDQKVEVELYKIRERITQLYFGILLIDEQLRQLSLVNKDIQSSLLRVEASIQNGTALKSNADVLRAELLKNEQREIELQSTRQSYLEMLGMFINTTLDNTTQLERPAAQTTSPDAVINRPELTLYGYQRDLVESQYVNSATRLMPRIGLFVQGGYGRPALNMLNNDFDAYYIGGLRLSWNLSGFYTDTRDREIRTINQQSIGTLQETFLFNTRLTMRQQNNELNKLQNLIVVDDKLITLRTAITNTSKVQLDNGVITANDYLRELNAEDQARQNKILHEIQLLMTQYNYQLTTGN